MSSSRAAGAAERLEGLGRRFALPVALLAIAGVAAAVRLVDIANNPLGFFADEASAGYNGYLIWTTGKDEAGATMPVMFRAFGEYKLPVFIYSQVPLLATLGMTELAVRLTSAIYGILTVGSVYLLATALFKQRGVALAAAFFIAIMPWHIHYSRTGFGEMVSFPFFLTLGLWLFLVGVRREVFLTPAALVLGLTLYTYRSAWVVLPPLLVLLAVLYRHELRASWRHAWPALMLFVIVAMPLVVHLLTVDGDRSTEAWIFRLDLGFWGTIERFGDHYQSYFSRSFLFDEGDGGLITRHYLPGYGHLYYIQLPFIVIGLIGLLWRPTREHVIVLALLALYPLAGALSDSSPFSTRAIVGTAVFSLLTGYGLVLAFDFVRGLKLPDPRLAAGALIAVVLAISLYNFGSYLEHYHGEYPNLSADFWGWQYGAKEVYTRFDAVEDDYDQLIIDSRFNAPRIFVAFYDIDCRKCRVNNAGAYRPELRQLFALRPESLPTELRYEARDVIRYPNGDVAFVLLEIVGPIEANVSGGQHP